MVAFEQNQLFSHRSVQIIWDEVLKSSSQENFVGVKFDDPYSVRKSVWVSYASGPTTFVGQEIRYRYEDWPELDFAFQVLLEIIARAGYSGMIGYGRRRFWLYSDRDSICWAVFYRGKYYHPEGVEFIRRCLEKVDKTLSFIATL